GDIDILITDKTGTLTSGHISFVRVIAAPKRNPLQMGLLATDTRFDRMATDVAGLNALDAALWARRDDVAGLSSARRLGLIPFSHDTRIVSSLVQVSPSERIVAVKGSAEDLAPMCSAMPPEITAALANEYTKGSRVVLVASKSAGESTTLKPEDLTGLTVDGLLVFSDEVKDNARASLDKLTKLGIAVKIATGDNVIVAKAVCAQLGLDVSDALSGSDIDGMDDATLRDRAQSVTVFARVSPEHKARIIDVLRGEGSAVGFMGDGVNDAIALHVSDVGISVDTATDVAKDAADIVLLKKDLGVVADGVLEGRRVFNNTMKYVFMGTSGDFGNMFSAAFGSIALNFLPMMPGQVLLNDVLYDSSQLAIPYDRVDPEAVTRPSHWNIGMIRRFMLTFGPISSIFDFATFALMILVFHAGEAEFQSGWFVESLATESLIVFVVRTRRVPFFRSLPSTGLIASVIAVVTIGCYLPYSPLAESIGFVALPVPFFLALLGMIIVYLVLVEFAKHLFFRRTKGGTVAPSKSHRDATHRVGRRAARFSSSSNHRSTTPQK
ncbi:MAG: HAD-IC family P-type ATPase, partial [Actinobacteria bacterium]|nr:HAD-IC family P-type ATPase [Actinomycetota bacterium]